MTPDSENRPIHASAVSVRGHGLLILGSSGSGKSGLALRMIALGAALVADDRVKLSLRDGRILAEPPETIAGMIEARGIGILSCPHVESTSLDLAVDIDQAPATRLPDHGSFTYRGVGIPLIRAHSVPHLAEALMLRLAHGQADT